MEVLTQLKPKAMGMYSASTSYIANSLVMSTDGAKAYLSVKAVPAGTPLTNTEYWKVHTDLSSARESALAAADKANAARDEMLEIARGLTDPVEVSGNPVSAVLAGRLPFDGVTSSFAPIQAGSGEPSLSNIRAISGWTGANLTRCGKNLFTGWIRGEGISPSTGIFKTESSAARTDYISVMPFAQIEMSGLTTGINNFVAFYDSAKIFISRSGAVDAEKVTIVTPENCVYLALTQYEVTSSTGNIAELKDTVQLEYGKNVTEYTFPAGVKTYTAQFPQTIYGGTLDWVTGLLTVTHGGHTFDGTEQITRYNDRFISQMLDSVINSYETDVVCSHYPVASSGDYRIGIGSGASRLEFWDSAYTTADAFKEYLAAQATAGTPVQIAYKLAKPTTIQLTAQEIAQLSGTNMLYGDGGAITIHGRQRPDTALLARIEALEGK